MTVNQFNLAALEFLTESRDSKERSAIAPTCHWLRTLIAIMVKFKRFIPSLKCPKT